MSMATYEIDMNIEQVLIAEAQRTGTSTSVIVSEAVARHLQYLEYERKTDAERDKEFLLGEFISDKAMDTYMEGLFKGEKPEVPKVDIALK